MKVRFIADPGIVISVRFAFDRIYVHNFLRTFFPTSRSSGTRLAVLHGQCWKCLGSSVSLELHGQRHVAAFPPSSAEDRAALEQAEWAGSKGDASCNRHKGQGTTPHCRRTHRWPGIGHCNAWRNHPPGCMSPPCHQVNIFRRCSTTNTCRRGLVRLSHITVAAARVRGGRRAESIAGRYVIFFVTRRTYDGVTGESGRPATGETAPPRRSGCSTHAPLLWIRQVRRASLRLVLLG